MSTAPPGRDSLGIFLPGPVPEAHQAGTGGHMLPACCHGWKLRPAQPGPFGKSWAAGQKLQRDERKKKAPACASAGAPHSAAAHSSSQPASPRPFPRQAPLPSTPLPPSIRFDFLLPCLACLASTPSSLPPCPPPPSSTSFLLSFLLHLHLPSAICRLPPSCCCSISSLVKVRASKRPFSIPSLRPRSASSSSPR